MSPSVLRRLVFCGLLYGGLACGDSGSEPLDLGSNDAGSITDTGARDLGPNDLGHDDASPADAAEDAGFSTDVGGEDAEHPDAVDIDATVEDASEPDAEPADAEPADAEPADAEPVDAEPADAEPSDSGPADTGVIDSGPADTGVIDSGPADTGVIDSGPADTGVIDSGPADTGVADAGTVPPTCNPTMGAAEACGGNPVGNWTYNTACVDPDVFAAARQSCPFLTATQFGASASGTLNLNANSTFSRNGTATFVYEVIVPSLCRQAIGTCGNVAVYIENSIPASQRVANCLTLGNGSCECTVTVTQFSNDSGSYTIDAANGILTLNALEYYYCVSGNGLLYKGTDNNAVDALICNVLTR